MMASGELRVALIAGPVYDRLYRSIQTFEQTTGIGVKIEYRGSHPELNAHLSSLKEVPYDLVSTHTKYAPSQLSFLAPLDELASYLEVDTFYKPLLDLATIGGHLYGIPRNIDVKLLHYRTDLVAGPPQDWNELLETASRLSERLPLYGFAFTGMESGLFGMFYELAEMGEASLFPASNIPRLNNEGGRWALRIIRNLYSSGAVPAEVVRWHFDEVHRSFLGGDVAMICDWPGYYGAYRDSPESKIRGMFEVARMPAGPGKRNKAYGGAHTFALTRRGAEDQFAAALLRFLTSSEQQLVEARQGSVPARPSILAKVRGEVDPQQSARWTLLEWVISNDILIPPRLPYYPEIEEILWRTVRSAMTGEISIQAALETMENRIAETHTRYAGTRTQAV